MLICSIRAAFYSLNYKSVNSKTMSSDKSDYDLYQSFSMNSVRKNENNEEDGEEDKTPSKKMKLNSSSSSDGMVQSELKLLAVRLVEAGPDLIPDISEAPTREDVQQDFNKLMRFAFKELQMVVAWARKVPGFDNLQMSDRIAIIKSSFMDLSVLRLTFRSMETPGRLKISPEFILTLDESVAIGWNRQVCSSNLELVNRFRALDFDLTEFSILSAVVLLYPDAVGIIDKAMVTDLQNRMLDCLHLYCYNRFPENFSRYGKIIIRLTALRAISASASEHFIKLTNEGRIQMDALITEIMS